MDTVLGILRLGEDAVKHSDSIAMCICELHVLVLETYGADVVKPKFHFAHHLAPIMKRTQTSCSCFSNERRNGILKDACGRLFHLRDMHRFAFGRWLDEYLQWYLHEDLTPVRALGHRKAAPDLKEMWRWWGPKQQGELVAAGHRFPLRPQPRCQHPFTVTLP